MALPRPTAINFFFLLVNSPYIIIQTSLNCMFVFVFQHFYLLFIINVYFSSFQYQRRCVDHNLTRNLIYVQKNAIFEFLNFEIRKFFNVAYYNKVVKNYMIERDKK